MRSLFCCIRPEIRSMGAYHVADATGLIKLDAMENPYTLPDDLKAQLAQELAQVAMNRYPTPTYTALKDELRRYALPTSGTARFSSPLGVYDFQKRSSMIQVSEAGAQTLGQIASTLAHGEGLTAHARSAEFRLNPAK